MFCFSRISKGFVIAMLLAIVFSCDNTQSSNDEITTINVENAYNKPHREVMLSEFVKDIEYIKLETNKNCFMGQSAYPQDVSDQYLLFVQYRPQRIMLFSRDGKYLNDIGEFGNGPGEYTNCDIPEISPDEKYILFKESRSTIYIYNIDGTFHKKRKIPVNRLTGLGYTSNGLIAVFKERMELPDQGGCQMYLYNNDLSINDSMLYSTQDQQGTLMLGWDKLITNGSEMYFQNRLNDTIYNISASGEIYPEVVMKLGAYCVPSIDTPTEQQYDYMHMINFTSSPSYYLITFFGDPKFKQPPRIGRAYLVYNKQTEESYFLKEHEIFTPEKVSTSRMPNNDLDGLFNPTLFFSSTLSNTKNEVYCMDKLEVPDVMDYLSAAIIEPDKLVTQKYLERVKSIIDESEIEDNPIIRICYLK